MRDTIRPIMGISVDIYNVHGRQIGGLVNFEHGGRNVWAAFAHDFESPAAEYDPLALGMFDDRAEAEREVVSSYVAITPRDPSSNEF
jgi:hypothetical protein